MNEKPESEIQSEIIKYVESKGYLCFRMNAGYSGRHNVKLSPPGTPDLLVVYKNRVMWIEVKAPNGKLRETQKAMIKKLIEMGQLVIIADSVEYVMEVI